MQSRSCARALGLSYWLWSKATPVPFVMNLTLSSVWVKFLACHLLVKMVQVTILNHLSLEFFRSPPALLFPRCANAVNRVLTPEE